MADMFYKTFLANLGLGKLNLATDTIKCVLLGAGYVPDAQHTSLSDVAAAEITGPGYTAGGQALKNQTWSPLGSGMRFSADDLEWLESTFSARYAVLYDATVEGHPLICLYDFGGDRSVTASVFAAEFDTNNGILTLGAQ